MTTLRTAAQQALEALMNSRPVAFEEDAVKLVRAHQEAIEALRAALAEPVEPVAWRFQSALGGWAYGSQPPLGSKYPVYPLYTAPPQRKPLTEEEIREMFFSELRALPSYPSAIEELPERLARAIEQAHGIGGSDE